MDRSHFLDDIRAAEKQNVKKFFLDLVDYCLGAVGLNWPKPDDDGLYQRVFFKPPMGDTILRYRNTYDEKFRVNLRKENPFNNINKCVSLFMKAHFEPNSKASIPFLFFGFCAFLVDLSIFCGRYHKPHLVPHAIEAAADVYDHYLGNDEEHVLWGKIKSFVANMHNSYERMPMVERPPFEQPPFEQPQFEEPQFAEPDPPETSLSSSSNSSESETEDLVICLERRRSQSQAKQRENLDPTPRSPSNKEI